MNSDTASQYRPDIDGLRAIAILAVIFFHAGFGFVPGGFVGVDIFFVISGYLITRIIVTENRAGTFTFKRFYERRIRRIVPALLFALCGVLSAGYFIFSPFDYKDISVASFAALLFLGNLTSYRQTDYFDSAAEFKPTLHLWSLGIEEQYYLLAPLVILLFIARKRHVVYFMLASIIIVSLLYGEHLLETNQRAAFYFLPSRFWELMLGAVTGIISIDNNYARMAEKYITTPVSSALGIIGFTLISVSIFSYSKTTSFPGINALAPTLGAAVILLFNKPSTIAYSILTFRPTVLIGLISYSAYLWHQPLFAITRYQSINEITTTEKTALIIATLAIAYFSYRYVETPFRKKGLLPFKRVLVYLGIPFIGISSACIYIYNSNGAPNRFDGSYQQALVPFKIRESDTCDFKQFENLPSVKTCDFGELNSNKTIFLFGDSHASVLIGGLDQAFKEMGYKGRRVKINGCAHFIPGMIAGEPSDTKIAEAKACNKSLEALLSHVKSSQADAFIVNVRWASRFSPIPGRIDSFAFDNGQGGVELKPDKPSFALDNQHQWSQGESAKRAALSGFISKLAHAAPKLFIIYPTPEPGWDVPKYNFSHYLKSDEVPENITVKYSLFNNRQSFIKESFDSIEHDAIVRIIPEKYLCEPSHDICYLQRNHIAYFYDTNHLSYAGAKPLVDEIILALKDKPHH